MNDKTIIDIGKSFFWISFVLGNICLFGYVISQMTVFACCGFLWLFFGSIINLLAVFVFLIYGLFNKNKLDICLQTIGIMLINIPLAAIYAAIGMELN